MRPETKTIKSLIDHIDYRLLAAIHYNSEAAAAIKHGRINEAMGTLIPIEQDLELALTLYRAAIARRTAHPEIRHDSSLGSNLQPCGPRLALAHKLMSKFAHVLMRPLFADLSKNGILLTIKTRLNGRSTRRTIKPIYKTVQ